MREIKFRAWDIEFKEMCFDPCCMWWNEDNELESWEGKRPSGCAAILEKGEFILMQFTGLLDSKGKEIYEGDIVLLGVLPTDEEDGEEHLAQVLFSRGQFWCTHHGFPVKSWACNDKCFIEIIGNIYESPELLEE